MRPCNVLMAFEDELEPNRVILYLNRRFIADRQLSEKEFLEQLAYNNSQPNPVTSLGKVDQGVLKKTEDIKTVPPTYQFFYLMKEI